MTRRRARFSDYSRPRRVLVLVGAALIGGGLSDLHDLIGVIGFVAGLLITIGCFWVWWSDPRNYDS